MTEPRRLQTAQSSLPQETAAFLRQMAERADRGEIIAVTVIEEHQGGTYGITGTGTLSRLQTMGALFECLLMRSAE